MDLTSLQAEAERRLAHGCQWITCLGSRYCQECNALGLVRRLLEALAEQTGDLPRVGAQAEEQVASDDERDYGAAFDEMLGASPELADTPLSKLVSELETGSSEAVPTSPDGERRELTPSDIDELLDESHKQMAEKQALHECSATLAEVRQQLEQVKQERDTLADAIWPIAGREQPIAAVAALADAHRSDSEDRDGVEAELTALKATTVRQWHIAFNATLHRQDGADCPICRALESALHTGARPETTETPT
jgi:hypothetical protein